MKILSEKTNKYYATVDECLKAEKEFDEAVAAKKAKEEKLTAERKERAAEVEKAYKAVVEANENYHKMLDAFVKDYGSFHMTIHTGDFNPFNAFGYAFNW